MTSIELINSFVAEKLDGDIQRLADFPLGSLRSDKVYGCPNRNFDSDDTELMRGIYCVVFGDTWENISMDNLGDGRLRGDTLNTYNTLFSAPWKERFTEIWQPDEELRAKIKAFNTTSTPLAIWLYFQTGALVSGASTSIVDVMTSGTITRTVSWLRSIRC